MLKEMMKFIGKEVSYNIHGLTVQVKVIDIRQAYGRIDYRITPINGKGNIWVSSSTLSL